MDWLLLVRHGEAEHHTKGLTGGWTDVPLTETGRAQLQKLGKRVKHDFGALPFKIITSDLVRARESAQIISDVTGFSVVEQARWLREKNNGVAAGLHEDDARKLAFSPLPDGNGNGFYVNIARLQEQHLIIYTSHEEIIRI